MRRTVALALMLALLSIAALSCKPHESKTVTATSATTGTSDTVAAQGQPTASGTKTDVGSTMPAYTALNLDGSKFDLAAKRDRVVLLNVWATWCGPCRFEIPELQNLHDTYAARGLDVIGVSVDESDTKSITDFVAEQQKMTYPIVHDADGKIATLLDTSVLPTTVVVDRTGKIVWKRYGAITKGDEELKKAIESSL